MPCKHRTFSANYSANGPGIQASVLHASPLGIYPHYYLPSQDLIFKGIHNGGLPTAPRTPGEPNITLTTNPKPRYAPNPNKVIRIGECFKVAEK